MKSLADIRIISRIQVTESYQSISNQIAGILQDEWSSTINDATTFNRSVPLLRRVCRSLRSTRRDKRQVLRAPPPTLISPRTEKIVSLHPRIHFWPNCEWTQVIRMKELRDCWNYWIRIFLHVTKQPQSFDDQRFIFNVWHLGIFIAMRLERALPSGVQHCLEFRSSSLGSARDAKDFDLCLLKFCGQFQILTLLQQDHDPQAP
mmetsp:Transcript_125788/g.199379  ORF Transcript_125788/g.199379 Transcript_125788/m.199379 type:complete len:204 (-) Transcript_125788:162-773(-)